MISSCSALLSQAPKTTYLIATHTTPSLSGDISLGIIIEYISLLLRAVLLLSLRFD
jgi:hypothetical protein